MLVEAIKDCLDDQYKAQAPEVFKLIACFMDECFAEQLVLSPDLHSFFNSSKDSWNSGNQGKEKEEEENGKGMKGKEKTSTGGDAGEEAEEFKGNTVIEHIAVLLINMIPKGGGMARRSREILSLHVISGTQDFRTHPVLSQPFYLSILLNLYDAAFEG